MGTSSFDEPHQKPLLSKTNDEGAVNMTIFPPKEEMKIILEIMKTILLFEKHTYFTPEVILFIAFIMQKLCNHKLKNFLLSISYDKNNYGT